LATGEPLYVIDINPISLDVTVGSKDDLKKEILHLRDVNWIGDDEFSNQTLKVKVKIGSTLNLEGANLVSKGKNVSVKLDSGLREGISPGQACVFYDNKNSSRVLGGGWIFDNRLS
jgi:tRNA-specific 2-thiouridylase